MKGHDLSFTIPKPYIIGGLSTIVIIFHPIINIYLPFGLSNILGFLVNNIGWTNNYSLQVVLEPHLADLGLWPLIFGLYPYFRVSLEYWTLSKRKRKT